MRVTVLGVGRLGASHAANLRALSDVTQLRIYDSDPARAAGVAGPLEAEVAPSVEAALTGADAAIIVTPTGTHAALIRQCVGSGVPTFCEKPVALRLDDTRAVAEEVERTSARVQIGFQRRFDAGYRRARMMLAEGEIGSVYSFYMVSRDAIPPPDEYIATSGGQFKDQLIHDFDITRWLFADEVEELYANGSTSGFERYREMGDVATAGVALRMRGGAIGLISGARHNPAGYDIRVEIYGSRDSIAIGLDPRSPIRSVEVDAPPVAGPAYPSFFVRFGDAYRAELAHFLRFARGEVDNACTVRDGLEALRLAEAAERSRQQGRPVRLSEIG